MSHSQLEPGSLLFSIPWRDVDGWAVRVDRADPVIRCTEEFLTDLDPRWVRIDDDLVTFTASNGAWVYRIVDYDFLRRMYTLAWPD